MSLLPTSPLCPAWPAAQAPARKEGLLLSTACALPTLLKPSAHEATDALVYFFPICPAYLPLTFVGGD
ncbi:MAG: hypothetical protein IKN64_02850 [Desulfovibrio sp.]|nr:hypothetical protein [Desulfovibrio sp.]